MSATRLLVLGLVRARGRTHGYSLGLELRSWGTSEWANTKWGSLYHALRQLTKRGMLLSFENAKGENGQSRTEYEITAKGEIEFFTLLRDALRTPEFHLDSLCAALAMLGALPRDEAIELLRERLRALEAKRRVIDHEAPDGDMAVEFGSMHELVGLWTRETDTGIDWTRGLIERLENGAHVMADERTPDVPEDELRHG